MWPLTKSGALAEQPLVVEQPSFCVQLGLPAGQEPRQAHEERRSAVALCGHRADELAQPTALRRSQPHRRARMVGTVRELACRVVQGCVRL